MSTTAIVWFRRDLRLADNPALDHARSHFDRVVPVYIHNPEAEGDWAPGAASCWWLHHSLAALDERLRQRGSSLIIASGDTEAELVRMIRACSADAVLWNRLYDPTLVRRDKTLKKCLRDDGVEAESFNAGLLFEPWEIVKKDGSPYLVFTPYWKQMQKQWRSVGVSPEPRQLNSSSRLPASLKLEQLKLLPDILTPACLVETGAAEIAARSRLGRWFQ